MEYLYDSFDKAIADLLEIDVQKYCKVMSQLYESDIKKWRKIIDGAKSGNIEELNNSKQEIERLCSER